MLEILGLVVGLAGFAWGVYSHLDARRQSRRRQEAELARRAAEDARREAEQASEALREIPVVVVDIARPPARRSRGAEVEVTVENKGPTVAREVSFGVRWGGDELAARLHGSPGPSPVTLGVGEQRSGVVQLPAERSSAAVPLPWVRFSDQRGEQHAR